MFKFIIVIILITTISWPLNSFQKNHQDNNMTAAETGRSFVNLSRTFQNLNKNILKRNFYRNCIQKKTIPFGSRLKFNLCQDVNNENLVNRLENILEQASSRIIETLEENCNETVEHFETEFENIKTETLETFGDKAGKKLILDAKKYTFEVTLDLIG